MFITIFYLISLVAFGVPWWAWLTFALCFLFASITEEMGCNWVSLPHNRFGG